MYFNVYWFVNQESQLLLVQQNYCATQNTMCSSNNKTGLQPVSRLVEGVPLLMGLGGGGGVGAKSLWCQSNNLRRFRVMHQFAPPIQ